MSSVLQPLLSRRTRSPEPENPQWFTVNENLYNEIIHILHLDDPNKKEELRVTLGQLNERLKKVEDDMKSATYGFMNSSPTKKVIRDMAEGGHLEVERLANTIASDFEIVRLTIIGENAAPADNPGQANLGDDVNVPLLKQAETILELNQKAQEYFAQIKDLQEDCDDRMAKAAKERLDRLKFALKFFVYSMGAVGGVTTLLSGRFKMLIDFKAR